MPRAASGRARLLQISGLSQRPPQTDPALICNHEVIRGWPIPGWPDFGRTRVLNIGQGCAAVSVTRPRQQAYAQVASARDAAYGSPRPRGVPPILLTQPGVPPWRLGAGGWGQLSSIRLRRRSMSRRRCLCRSMDTSLSPPFRGWKRAEGHQVPGSGSGQSGPGMAASMATSSARSVASRSISVPISTTWRRSRASARSHAQVPVSRMASSSRISASRSPSRWAPRMNSSRSRSAGPYRRCSPSVRCGVGSRPSRS